MSFEFRPAVRESVGLLIGLAGASGSGKTFSAMRLASGMAGDKPFCVIDTEAGRAKHYADQFRFDHGDMHPPFSPDAFADAITSADKAGYPVIVVDSVSHVWAGDGGVLDWQEAELDRMAGDDWKKREAVKMAAWIKPKMSHKAMVQKLLQVRAHLILCFRAEQKIEMVRGDNGKMQIVAKQSLTGLDGWIPVCEKNLPFELTASFLLLAQNPGIPMPIKLQEQHKALFPDGKPIDEAAGKRIAVWATGGAAPVPTDYTATLNAAKTLDELIAAWSKIPKAEQKKYSAAKDARKAELTAPKPDATEPTLSARIAACTALDALEVIAEAFTEDEAVKYMKAYTAKKHALQDAAAGGNL